MAAAAVLLLAAGCGDDGDAGGSAEPEVVGDTVPDAPTVEVEASDFAFSPNPLALNAGEPVNLVLRVTSGGHNVRIEGTDFQLPIVEEGDAVVSTLTVAEPGEYRMVCTVPGHESAGMVATVRVG